MSRLMEMIPNIIYDYLSKNRRITIAGLGTFLTKGGRESVLFSEFMKSDDGTLRTLLTDRGVSEVEAEAQIENFVEEVKIRITSGEAYEFPLLGALRMVDGAIVLEKIIEPNTPHSSSEEKMIDSIVDSIADSFMHREETDEEYEEESPRFDIWLIGAMAAGAVALFALLYGVAIDWMTGKISFGGAIDRALEGIFFR